MNKLETAIKIEEQNGSCNGISCSDCYCGDCSLESAREYIKQHGGKPMNKEELKKNIARMKAEIVEMEKQVEQMPDDKVLRVRVAFQCLFVSWGEKNLLAINKHGEMKAMDCHNDRIAWQEWVDAGKPTDDSAVEWRGKKYRIDWNFLVSDCVGGDIYSFDDLRPCVNCQDSNVQRYSNNTPILF